MQREQLVVRERRLSAIYDPYRTLRQRCDAVRYDLRQLRTDEAKALIDSQLASVRECIAQLLGP